MFYTFKIPGVHPISPACINSACRDKYRIQLLKHGLDLTNVTTFNNTSYIDGLNLRPLFYKKFDKIVGSLVTGTKLTFDGIPYYNFFLANKNDFIETTNDRTPIVMTYNGVPTIPSLLLVQSGTTELPPFILNFMQLNEPDRVEYLNTLPTEIRRILLNEDFNSPIFLDNISSLTISLQSQLGINWLNTSNHALL